MAAAAAVPIIMAERELEETLAWIDLVPLSRTKKNISRVFSDAVLCAEVIAHFVPRLVNLNFYKPSSSVTQKKSNWTTLNDKVFSKLRLKLTDDTIKELTDSKSDVIEKVLFELRKKLEEYEVYSLVKGPITVICVDPKTKQICSFNTPIPRQAKTVYSAVSKTNEPIPIVQSKEFKSFPSSSSIASGAGRYFPNKTSSSTSSMKKYQSNNNAKIGTATKEKTEKMVPKTLLEEKDIIIQTLLSKISSIETKLNQT